MQARSTSKAYQSIPRLNKAVVQSAYQHSRRRIFFLGTTPRRGNRAAELPHYPCTHRLTASLCVLAHQADYDGTLAPHSPLVELCAPPQEVLDCLGALSQGTAAQPPPAQALPTPSQQVASSAPHSLFAASLCARPLQHCIHHHRAQHEAPPPVVWPFAHRPCGGARLLLQPAATSPAASAPVTT